MTAPLTTTDQPSGGARRRGDAGSNTWQELEEVFAALGQLARSAVAPADFYRTLLDQSVGALGRRPATPGDDLGPNIADVALTN